MQYIIGGYSDTSDLLVESAIKFFEDRFSRAFNFKGIVNQGYFLGIVEDQSNEMNNNIKFFEDCKVFKSLYYPTIPDVLKNGNTVTVEPGIYIVNFGGIRIEDTVLVNKKNAERLTEASYEFAVK